MSTFAKTAATAESMTFDGVVSPRSLFTSILNDEVEKAAYKQCKSERIKCVNEILPRHPIWYTRQSGIQKLFAGLGLPNVHAKDDGDVRYYRSSTRERNGSRHTLEWAEQRGSRIMVVSRRLVRRRREGRAGALPTDHGWMRHREVGRRMREVQRGVGRGRHLNRVFCVVKVKDAPEEAIWCLVRKVPQNTRTFKSPLTPTEKARERWRVEREEYVQKQQYR